MEKVLIAKVAVAAAAYTFDKPYDYIVPGLLAPKAMAGVRVTVPFGKGNKISEAMILDVQEGENSTELKRIQTVLDDAPVLDQRELRLAYWMRERYFCTVYDAIKVILPSGLWYRLRETYHIVGSLTDEEIAVKLDGRPRLREVYDFIVSCGGQAELETVRNSLGDVKHHLKQLCSDGLLSRETSTQRKLGDKTVKRVYLAIPSEEALAVAEKGRKRSPMRHEVISLLASMGSALSSDLVYFTGVSAATLKSMEKAGLIRMEQEEAFRVPVGKEHPDGAPIVLNDEQQVAFDGMLSLAMSGKAACALLHGVTGSGKTQVYIRLLQEVIAAGKTGMVLVPEIALTPQIMDKFSAYFGSKVVMLHSSLRLTERYDQWKRIKKGEVQVVLGTRSAVFAPLKNLGLIILDEEQEGSYQSENAPRYHARDVAKYRCAEAGATLVLGSATPTVESSFFARTGRYHQFHLQHRYNTHALPAVYLADMRHELRKGNSGSIGSLLYNELKANIENGEQSILFLNRRGSSRMLLCGECGAVPECPRCSVPLTYHSANDRLMCHYCGYSRKAGETCPECGGIVKHVGTGTQKVEEELKQLFPDSEILRMDADTVSGGHEKILSRFQKEKVPILLGTQMVTKGLDFEHVTLVGVLAADLSLYVDHFRAAERTFSLLTQVVGRAGRGSKVGRAVIQTFTPDNDVIVSASRQDYDSFYASELHMRRLRRCPPFADLFTLTVSGMDEGQVFRAAAKLREVLKEDLRKDASCVNVEIIGPAPAPILKVNQRYRYRILWIGRNDHATRNRLSYYLQAFHLQKENRNLHLFIDCNSMD